MGSTRSQLLRKVQLPLARRMILLAVNQCILFALSMVVIAGLIGGGGLGAVVTTGLYSNPALAIIAGLVIVVMAMTLDRSTGAIAERARIRPASTWTRPESTGFDSGPWRPAPECSRPSQSRRLRV